MSFLLDTNVISESVVNPQPDPDVMAWMAEVDEDRVCLSVASLAEIQHGIELLAPGHRRDLVTCNTRDFEAFGIDLLDPSRRTSS